MIKKFLVCILLIGVIVALITIVLFEQGWGYEGLSIKDVQQGLWVTDDCNHDSLLYRCTGADIDFNSRDCQLKDDGFVYHDDERIGEFLGGFIPLISESSPRRGATLRVRDLKTTEICTWDSTSQVSILGL